MASSVWYYGIDRTEPNQTFGKSTNEISQHSTLRKAEENKPDNDEMSNTTYVVVKRRK